MSSDKVHSVLIVEDERIVANDLQQTLAAMGYDAFAIASSGADALLRASERCPDLVLMDIRIKGERDGIETASLLRERFGVPIVYLTAHADEATLERAKKTEPYGYLMKPVKAAELRSSIEVSIYKHEMEKRLRERERWASTTLHSIADAVVAVDLAGNVSFMNAAAETLIGITAGRATGRPVRDIVEHKTGLATEEAPREHAAGADRIVSHTAVPVMAGGPTLGTVMVFRDVTEQKLHRTQVELSDRLASLGTMAAGVAHEVNNPLAVVLANAQYVMEVLRHRSAHDDGTIADLDEAIRAQSDLEAAARRIAGIVANLQGFSRPTRSSTAEGDVGSAVAWAVRSMARELGRRANVVTSLASLPRVKLDETRVTQVLVNLLMNAAHAIGSGRPDANTVAITAKALGDNVVIAVRDTGCGMAPEVASRVFEPFYTTKSVGRGTGLGLAICHGIVTSVGGHIEVESQVGVGSTFRVTLPAVIGRAVSGALDAAEGPAPGVAIRRGRLLVIDDEPLVLRAMKRILSEHDAVYLADARDAVALLAGGAQFDVIFSDVMMSHMTGMELYEHLLAVDPEAARRIVFLTGGATSARIADFLAAVPNMCLHKPVLVNVLRAVIQERLGIAPPQASPRSP